MDRENANFQKALDSVQQFSEIRLIPVQLTVGRKRNFQGVIDLLTMKAYKGMVKPSTRFLDIMLPPEKPIPPWLKQLLKGR